MALLETRVLNQLLTDLGVERCRCSVESYLSTARCLFMALARGVAAIGVVATSEAAHQLISAASLRCLTAVATEVRALHTYCAARNAHEVRAIHARLQGRHPLGTDALTRHRQHARECAGAQA